MRLALNGFVFIGLSMLFCTTSLFATHNRAGEITYSHVEGLTYEVLITTYTKASALADRPSLYLLWGDENGEELDSLERERVRESVSVPRSLCVHVNAGERERERREGLRG